MGPLRARQEWKFFAVLPRADRRLALTWWVILVARGVLPAGFAIATGVLVGAVNDDAGLGWPLAVTAVVFVLMQVLNPIHTAVSANLGDRTAWERPGRERRRRPSEERSPIECHESSRGRGGANASPLPMWFS